MHMTQTKLFYPKIYIQHIKTNFQETNMRSRAKIFNEPHSFVLTNLKFFPKLFVQTRVPRGAFIIYVTLDKCQAYGFSLKVALSVKKFKPIIDFFKNRVNNSPPPQLIDHTIQYKIYLYSRKYKQINFVLYSKVCPRYFTDRCALIVWPLHSTASIAQKLELPLSEREVVGSNPTSAPYQRCKKWY